MRHERTQVSTDAARAARAEARGLRAHRAAMDRRADQTELLRDRCRELGMGVSDEQWAALPDAARRRLESMPIRTELDRATFRALVHWVLSTFPPGWVRLAG